MKPTIFSATVLLISLLNSMAQVPNLLGIEDKHVCAKHKEYVPPANADVAGHNAAKVATALTNVRGYTQSIHNAVAKWDSGSVYRYDFGTTPGGDEIYDGSLLWASSKYTPGRSFPELQEAAATKGNTFNIGDDFYLNLYNSSSLDTAILLQFNWENLGDTANNVTINIETNYGIGGVNPFSAIEAAKMMAFYDLVNPIVKEVYGPPSRDHIVTVVNDAAATSVNTFYNGPNQISSSYSLNSDGDLDQPRLMIHELVHAYRDNVTVSSDSTWHYDPKLSGFEEGMAEGVAIIVMDIFITRYPTFFIGDEFKVHWNHARGMPFEWDYDFQNHSQITTEDYWSTDQATGSHWIRYGVGAAAMRKMYIEDSTVFVNFNAQYYSMMNANQALVPTRNLMLDIFDSTTTTVERTPVRDWINGQHIFNCTKDIRKKVFILSFTGLSWASFQHDNRIFFLETHQNGLEWKWGSTDNAGTNEVTTGATWGWTQQLNNIPGDIDFIKDWDNTIYRSRSIINDGHWVTDAGGPHAGQTLLGPYQGANPYRSFDGLVYDGAGPFTRDLEQDEPYSIGPEMGKRAFAIGSQRLYTSTSTPVSFWPPLVSQGGTLLDSRAETSMNESGLFRFDIGFTDTQGPTVSDTYYRLLGDDFIDVRGVFGGIYRGAANAVNGRIFIQHDDYPIDTATAIRNNSFKVKRTWASVLETKPEFMGGHNDRHYTKPGETHAIYLDSNCTEKKIDFRTIGYGDGLRGVEMLLFNVDDFEDIIFTASNDTIIDIGQNFNLDIGNNFADIIDRYPDSLINYTWKNSAGTTIFYSDSNLFVNALITDSGTYTVEIDFLGCPIFTKDVHVTVQTSPTRIPELLSPNKELLYITDILGRTTHPTPNTLMFYIYDDGSVEKKIQLER